MAIVRCLSTTMTNERQTGDGNGGDNEFAGATVALRRMMQAAGWTIGIAVGTLETIQSWDSAPISDKFGHVRYLLVQFSLHANMVPVIRVNDPIGPSFKPKPTMSTGYCQFFSSVQRNRHTPAQDHS